MSYIPDRSVLTGHRYRDAAAAVAWLCDVLGFEPHAVYRTAHGTIAHAQLVHGDGMIMLGSFNDTDSQKLMAQPSEVGGRETRHCYVLVPDADAVFQRLHDAGGEILLGLQDQPHGGRGFTCRDPEGHIWNVGTYNPWRAVAEGWHADGR